MSSLTPIVFPEDHSSSNKTSSSFPFTSIDAEPNSQANINTNRMKQLESMLKEVQGRAEIVEKEAYDKAYLAGEKAGMVLGQKRGEQILESLQETLQEAESSLNAIQDSFAEAALDVAKHVAETIIGNTIKTEPSTLLDIAQLAAAQLPDHSGLHIAISPDDYSNFKRLLEDEKSMLSLKRDATVESGTCRIITNQQDILINPVAAVETYLSELRPLLLKPTSTNDNAQQT